MPMISILVRNQKSKNPNPKQIPNSKIQNYFHQDSGFGSFLPAGRQGNLLGAWCLLLGMSTAV